jgi:hypothetical protein
MYHIYVWYKMYFSHLYFRDVLSLECWKPIHDVFINKCKITLGIFPSNTFVSYYRELLHEQLHFTQIDVKQSLCIDSVTANDVWKARMKVVTWCATIYNVM